jgi:bifunctional DNA-binding transcriptional regulator/antitoxin component of YhaV-PrlF toxin-antitoxin module
MPLSYMALVRTTRLKKQDSIYEIEIPKEFIIKLDWRDGHILEINEQNGKLVIEKIHGFLGS